MLPKLRTLCALGLVLLLGGSWGSAAEAADKVSLQLRWDHQFQFAGYYAAQWIGFFAASGLEVELRPRQTGPSGPVDIAAEVSSGRADFGVGGADFMVAHDRGADVVLVSAIFPRSMAAFFSLADRSVEKPADLPQLRVARNPDDLIDIELQAMLASSGIDPALVPPRPVEIGMLADLRDRRIDVIPGYSISLPFVAARMGLKLSALEPREFGIDLYGDSLFVRGALAREHPELVARFQRAVLQGWAYAVAHPQEIAQRIVTEFSSGGPPDERLAFNLFQAQRIVPMIDPLRLVPEATNPLMVRRMHEQLRKLGLLQHPYDSAFLFDEAALAHQKTGSARQIATTAAISTLLVAGLFLGMISIFSAVLRRRTRDLRLESRRYKDFAEASSDWLWEQDASLRFSWLSPSHDRSAGVSGRQSVGRRRDEVRVPTPEESDWQQYLREVALHRPIRALVYGYLDSSGALRWNEVNGVPVHDERGAFCGYRGTAHDVTERVVAKRRAQAQAERDPLTDLPNRRSFETRLRAIFGLASRGRADCWVLVLDLDGFKLVNDQAGHHTGDELLVMWAERMLTAVRSDDMVARFGGDEFVILISQGDRLTIESIAGRLVEAASRPFELQAGTFTIGVSIGIAGSADDDNTVEGLVAAADQALYAAKARGRGRFVFADEIRQQPGADLLNTGRRFGGIG